MMERETVVAVRPMRPYLLDLTFADGTRREVDIEPLLWGEVFEPMRDWDTFAQVRVDPEIGTVVWPNGTDLAPEFLYYGEDTPYGRVNIRRPAAVAPERR